MLVVYLKKQGCTCTCRLWYASYFHIRPSQVGNLLMLSGQIGLVPYCMTLADKDTQPLLALTHIQKVMAANGSGLNMALGGVCYCTCLQTVSLARQTWKKVSWLDI